MKKYLLVLLISLFLIPVFVDAKETGIQIKSVELIEKSENAIELEEAKFQDLEVWFNLKFVELNDYAKYKIVMSNNSDEDYKINDANQIFTDEKYIDYVFEYDNDDNLIKAGDEETMIVSITYTTEVLEDDFVDNVYKNDNYMNLNFSAILNEDNPNTNDHFFTFVVTISIASILLVICAFKLKNVMYGVIALALFIPVIGKAIEKTQVDIYAKVEIEKKVELSTFDICGNTYQYEPWMTLYDWVNSKYNTDNWTVEKLVSDVYMIKSEEYVKNMVIANYDADLCGYGECVSPTSMISVNMSGDIKLAKDIKVNDNIVYFDFDANTMKIGTVGEVFIHHDATDFVRYTLEDDSYIEATDYHPIYTKDGWKSYTNRNGYATPVIGDEVKTFEGYKKITNIEIYNGKEDFYDFLVVSGEGELVDNYYANGILVHSSY